MTPHSLDIQRRQFGRRQTNTRATAAIPGAACISCEIRNVSEGGALVDFFSAAIPARPFRLMIENTDLELLCEPRHTSGTSVGVRFLNSQDGALLMRHLYPDPVLSQSTWKPDPAPLTVTVLNLGELRTKLMAAWTAAQNDQSQTTLQPAKPVQDDGLVRSLFAAKRKFAAAGAAMTRRHTTSLAPSPHGTESEETRPPKLELY